MEKTFGPEHPLTTTTLNNLAQTYSALAQYDKALPLQIRALAIDEKAFGPEHPNTAIDLENLAIHYSRLIQYDKALLVQIRALAINEKVLGPEHPYTAHALNNLAGFYFDLAQYDKALPLQIRALAINERIFGSQHPLTAVSFRGIAGSYELNNQPELAIAFYKLAINIYQGQRKQISLIGQSELLSYSASIAGIYQHLALLLTDQGRLAEAQVVLDMLKEDEQFNFTRRAASADPRRTRIGYNSTEKIWMGRYRKIADHLAALRAEDQLLQKQSKLGLSSEQKQRQQALISDLRIAHVAFESNLKEMQESFAHRNKESPIEVEELSAQASRESQGLLRDLGEGVALLQYFVTDHEVSMILTTSGIQLKRNSKIEIKELNRQIAEFQRLLGTPTSNPLPAAQALYRILVAPVAKDLEGAGVKTVMLSLSDALRYLPFGALHDGQGYMIKRWNLPMYTNVTKNRLREAVTPQWNAVGLGVTKALGKDFSALPAVQAEMDGIIKTKKNGGWWKTGGALSGEVYLDEEFTAKRLRDVSQRQFQVLHVASHFKFSPGTEVDSFLLLGDGQQLTIGDMRTQNYRFDNVDLLTLSACETGLGGGQDKNGREIEGFGVIAQQQGAKAVLATLWNVADQSTAILMADLYRYRQDKHLTKIEALRQAQLTLQDQPKYSHPYFWAPFILMGNWK